MHLDHSMQISVVPSINKVFFIGGSYDRHFNEWSDLTREWDLRDNVVRFRKRMPFK